MQDDRVSYLGYPPNSTQSRKKQRNGKKKSNKRISLDTREILIPTVN